MASVGRIQQTDAAPELRSQIVSVLELQSVFEFESVCAATAWVCDLGPSLFCGMVLLQEDGWSLPVENLSTATASIITNCSTVATQTSARFLDEPGEFSILGRVMREESRTRISNINFGYGRRIVVAGGDDQTRDLDLVTY